MNLDSILKYEVQVTAEAAGEIAALLVSSDSDYPDGSSFAVTTDSDHGSRCLKLSHNSLERIQKHSQYTSWVG